MLNQLKSFKRISSLLNDSTNIVKINNKMKKINASADEIHRIIQVITYIS